jgi:dTDP-4-dehydrorhamnose 3,5-epimerase
MLVEQTAIRDVLVVTPRRFTDERGYFEEVYHEDRYKGSGVLPSFVQQNMSFSSKGVIRGLHYQRKNAQAKLVTVLQGEILDVAVDIRKDSPTYGKWVSEILSEENGKQLFIPVGFAHGFSVISETARVLYQCSALYAQGDEFGIRWDDPSLAIDWQVHEPISSPKDLVHPFLVDVARELLF